MGRNPCNYILFLCRVCNYMVECQCFHGEINMFFDGVNVGGICGFIGVFY